jgi:hypothetical protein
MRTFRQFSHAQRNRDPVGRHPMAMRMTRATTRSSDAQE